MSLKTQLIIIQPTPFCNIACRYCYLPDRTSTKRISTETLAQIFNVFFSSSFVSDRVTFVWHASEPLVLPISFYEEAFHLQQSTNRAGIKIVNSFQTNATLITQSWCDFFKAYDVHIGVSIDGPQHIHDANRTDRAGHGTFDRVMEGIELLRVNNIDYSAIAVVTQNSVHDPDALWQFFTDLGLSHLGLNPEEMEGANTYSSLDNGNDIKLYKKFFKRLLTLNAQNNSRMSIREIDGLMQRIASSSLRIRTRTNTPMGILSFDCHGNISTFSPELLTMTHSLYGTFTFGNVFQDTLEAMYTNPKFIAVNAQIQRGVARCRSTCEYFEFCGGGHPSNKIYENGTFDSTETVACRLKVKAASDALLEHLEEKYYLDAHS